MSEKNESKTEKGILARTATYTSKRARRAQTKLKQRVGKGDETKDEVFDEFVLNFNKQQASATRLHTELKNYLRCISAMEIAHTDFGEAFKEVYEDDWTSRAKMVDYFQEFDNCWTKLRQRVLEEVLEPLTSYLKPFNDVKTKIHKRARKLVDYDHSRHSVDTLRAKGANKSSDTKKLHHAEEEFQKAKDVFIDLTSELYEELPALYDSRIGFYVSCFQSIFTLEEVFHRDAANLNHNLNDLMDQLITDFSAGTFSTRKPFSAGLETSLNTTDKEKDDTKLSSGSLAHFYDVAVPGEEDSDETPPSSTRDQVDGPNDGQHDGQHDGQDDAETTVEQPSDVPTQPSRPAPILQRPEETPTSPDRPEQPELFEMGADNQEQCDPPIDQQQDFPAIDSQPPAEDASLSPESSQGLQPEDSLVAANGEEHGDPSPVIQRHNVVAYKNQPTPENPYNLIVPDALYKVIATYRYNPEDEDELTFEKGEIIHVIPYDDPEDQDEGWLMGVKDSDGGLGVFPENFSRRVP